VTDPGPVAARASLDVARVALGRMTSTGGNIAIDSAPLTMAARATAAWSATEHVLHNVTGDMQLAGQALVVEARRQERLTLDDAHAIVALSEWVERTRAPGSAAQMLTLPPTDAEREVGAHALVALEHAVGAYVGDEAPPPPFVAMVTARAETPNAPAPNDFARGGPAPSGPVPVVSTSKWAAPQDRSTGASPPSAASRAGMPPPPASGASRTSMPDSWSSPPVVETTAVPGTASGGRSSALVVGVVLLLLVAAAGAGWYVLRNRAGGVVTTDDGIAAYTRGSIETARLTLARAAQENPNDARALTYLGRIAREQGDLATSRKFLESAIRIEPENALALRELGSSLLADNQPELARRFYVRALTVDGSDRVAQGFLSCALIRLQRRDEAQRWLDRAGSGDWSRCSTPAPAR
jgi:hypothetical protein